MNDPEIVSNFSFTMLTAVLDGNLSYKKIIKMAALTATKLALPY